MAARSAALAVVLAGCAPGPTVVVEPGADAYLAQIRILQVGLAEVAGEAPGSEVVVDIGPDLSRRLNGSLRNITVVQQPESRRLPRMGDDPAREPPTAEAANATLLYRRADRLVAYLRPQSTQRWYWWATLVGPDGRTLATLHGEREKSRGEPEAQVARELDRLLQRARKVNRPVGDGAHRKG